MRIHHLLLIVLVFVMGVSAHADSPQRVRVLTYNIHHGAGTDGVLDLERIAGVIEGAEPDVVALQEVDDRTRRAEGVDQAGELGRLTGMEAVYGAAMDYDGGRYGVAILSRHPIEDVERHALPHGEDREPRTVLAVRVAPEEEGAEAFTVAGTHLQHNSQADRVAQAKEINEQLVEEDGGVMILAGDLNAEPGSEPMRVFGEHWQDAGDSAGAAGEGNTFPSAEPDRRIDYVLYRPADRWRVVEVRVIEEEVASDHRPVLVVLEMR